MMVNGHIIKMYIQLVWIFLCCINLSKTEMMEFSDKMFDKCAKELRGETSTNANLVCYWTFKNLLITKMEVISITPFIIQYHNMVHRRLCKRAIQEAEQLRLDQLLITGTSPTNAELSKVRAANGTWLNHKNRKNFARMFDNLNMNIDALDLNQAEPWQILSYDSTGYYAPHYDYLGPDTNHKLLKQMGNRIATVLVILKTAKLGGTTVFPKLNINIRPKAGDVIVWINFKTDSDSDPLTLHAACPIKDGLKIGATLWVHAKKQELSLPCSLKESHFETSKFFNL